MIISQYRPWLNAWYHLHGWQPISYVLHWLLLVPLQSWSTCQWHIHLLLKEACWEYFILAWVALIGFVWEFGLSVWLMILNQCLKIFELSNSISTLESSSPVLWPSPFQCWLGTVSILSWGRCIVSPHLWTDMSCSWTGPLTFRQWCHSIYVAQTSMTYGILILIHSRLPSSLHLLPSELFPSKLTTHGQSTLSADPHEA